ILCAARSVARDSASDWPNVGNDKAGTRYSVLDQINRDNVGKLKLAWTYHSGDAGTGTTIECTPVVVDGAMYVTTVKTKVVALDAATGEQRWSFDPDLGFTTPHVRASGGVKRGGARDLGPARCVERPRRGQPLGRVHRRHRERRRLHGHRLGRAGFPRRGAQAHQPLRRLRPGPGRAHGQAPVAFPDGPPRPLGPR